jgi:nucleoside-diphosphate-sugar epimerase
MTLLVTGAGGFVGAATVRAAAAAGHQVHALVRNRIAPRLAGLGNSVAIHSVDLCNGEAVARLLGKLAPDVVIHSAWEGVGGALRAGPVQLENIRTTVALADAAIAAGARKFVGIGSQAEYGRYDRRILESDVPRPTMLYGAAKLSANVLAAQRAYEHGMEFAWLRLFSVFGPGDNPIWLIPSVARSLTRGVAPKCTLGTQVWDYLHIEDVAEAVLTAAVTPAATGVFNLSSAAPIAVRTIVERLRDLAAPGLPLHFGEVPFGPDQIMHLEGDNTRLRELTGWTPRIHVLEGLADVVDELAQAA